MYVYSTKSFFLNKSDIQSHGLRQVVIFYIINYLTHLVFILARNSNPRHVNILVSEADVITS